VKAGVFGRVGAVEVQERPEPAVDRPADVLVRVLACGLCGSDLHILSDPPGHPATVGVVLGHEFTGEVEAVGADVTGVAPGDRVVVRPILTCGSCRRCRSGAQNHCANMDALGVYRDGGLATHVLVPESAIVPIATSVPPHIAALTEPLACVLNAVSKAQPLPGENVVVIGAGAIGLLFLAVLRAAGAGRALVVETSQARREVATRMGADVVVDPRSTDLAAAVTEHLLDGPDIVVDAVGSQLATAVEIAGRRARIVLFGLDNRARPEVGQFAITEKELSILGSYVGQDSFPDAVRLLESGRLDLEPIVSHRGGLEDVPELVERLRAGEVVKAVVEP
jgi:threonine dehydrogenase-like Zn-dependent dehydrogenase